MSANYIADFNSRPDAEYVTAYEDEKGLDYFDSEWEARVDFDRDSCVDVSVLELAAADRLARRRAREAEASESVLLVLNRKHLRLTVKFADGRPNRSSRYESLAEAMAALARVKSHFYVQGVATRTWIPAS